MKKTVLALIFFTQSFLLLSSDSDPLTGKEKETVIRRISETAKSINSIKSGFIQTKNISVLSEKIRSSGVFYYKSPGRIRWEYIKPYKYLIIYGGGKIFINDSGKKNEFDSGSNRIFQQVNDVMFASISGKITESPSFSVDIFRKSGRYIVRLVPKHSDVRKYVNSVEIFFDSRKNTVSEINIYENSGDYTNIVFRDQKINSVFSDDVFLSGN